MYTAFTSRRSTPHVCNRTRQPPVQRARTNTACSAVQLIHVYTTLLIKLTFATVKKYVAAIYSDPCIDYIGRPEEKYGDWCAATYHLHAEEKRTVQLYTPIHA